MTSQIRLGALFWVLTIELFITQFIAQAAWPAYSMATNDISLLGVLSCGGFVNDAPGGVDPVCSPLNLVFNIGMVANGILVVLGLWFTHKLWPQGWLTTTALWLLALGGDGSMLVGLFPLDTVLTMHMIGAGLALGIACPGFLLLAVVLWRSHRRFAIYTAATGAITLLAFILYLMGVYVGGRGTIERIAAWPHTIWYIVTGILILSGRLRARS